jgi:hypothetical protein
MGRCVQCEGFFPPHFMIDMELKKDPPQKCAYCYLDKSEVTMVNDDTGKEEKVSKKEAQKKYQIFLKRLYESKNVQEVIGKQKSLSLKND